MEEYNNVTILKKETNCIIFNIECSSITDSTCIEYRSPVFAFKEPPEEEGYLSFVSMLSRDKSLPQKVSGMTLHFTSKENNKDSRHDMPWIKDSTNNAPCTYQVVSSVLNRPEFGLHTFQSHRFGIRELKHWSFFSINDLLKAANKTGIIQLCFDITRFLNNNLNSINSVLTPHPHNDEKMLKLYCFLKNEEYTDITLKVDNDEIKAHKNILAAHSAVFDAMFKSKMQEEQTGIIKIENFRSEAVREMLSFVYTNNVEDLPKMAYELFEVAHFFNLTDLENLCKNYMMSNISVNNVTPILELAEKYSLKDVQINVKRFIKNNEALVVKNIDYLNHLTARLSVQSVANCLTLADKYKLREFKTTLKEFVKDNIKEVIKDSRYRYLYSTNMNLILEIDEYMANFYDRNEV